MNCCRLLNLRDVKRELPGTNCTDVANHTHKSDHTVPCIVTAHTDTHLTLVSERLPHGIHNNGVYRNVIQVGGGGQLQIIRAKCSLMYLGRLRASIVCTVVSIGAPRFLPLVPRFHDDLFIYSDRRLLIGGLGLRSSVISTPMQVLKLMPTTVCASLSMSDMLYVVVGARR